MGEKLVKYLLLAHFEQGIIHRPVVAEVDQVPPSIFTGGTEISMLKQAGERIASITDVDPVAIRELPVQGQVEALRPVSLAPFVPGPVVLGQGRHKATGETSWQRGDDPVNCPCALAGLYLPALILQLLDLLHARTQ